MPLRKKGLFSWLDPWLGCSVMVAVLVGFIAIATAAKGLGASRYLIIQCAAFLVGVAALFIITRVDYDYIGQLAPFIYIFNLALLVVVLFIGTGGEEVGTNGWIRIGPVGIQPAEIVKIGFIITFAKHIDAVKEDISRPLNVILLLLHGGLLIGLVFLQPDTGTALVFCVILLGMLFTAGIDWKYLASFGALIAAAIPLCWFFVLQEFQKNRILTFLNPALDPSNTGYHVIQSKIAIGAGGVLGRGLGNGIQTQFGYLPAKQTDFIYAVIGEEMGLWGCVLVLTVMTIIVVRSFVIAMQSRDTFGEMLCVGVGCMFMAHVFESIGMCLGLLPVTGIPLPFISSGGSNMLASMLGVALVVSVRMRRKRINF